MTSYKGDEIIFDDDVTREQIGEFPSQWDLLKGTVEIAQINGDKVILCVSQDDPIIAPLFDDMKNYLPEKFTLEFDFWVGPYKKGDGEPQNCYIVRFTNPDRAVVFNILLLTTGIIIVPQSIGQHYLGRLLLPPARIVVTEAINLSGLSRTHGTISHCPSINGQ